MRSLASASVLRKDNVVKATFILMVSVLVLSLFSCEASEEEEGIAMNITTPEFENSGFIPKRFTCQGEDINPALIIAGVPNQTKSLALIVDDPDAPMGTWVHWVVYDIPVVSRIDENSVPGKQGINDFGRKNYGGPCPPSGTHRYFFKLYALDKELNLKEGVNKWDLEKAIEGSLLDKAELIGLYKKQ
ncbi:YbhB/YbcL family Raf kinase inhibitor-like protein [Candidatus Omnitrophota bacterium]